MKALMGKISAPYYVIISGCVLLLISFGIRHATGLFMVPVSDHLNTGREVFSFAVAVQFLMIGFGSPLFGAIADKYGSGKAAFCGVILLILGLYMVSNVETSFDIILAQAIFGLGSAGCGTAVVLGAVGKAVAEKNRTLILGIVMAAGSLGQFLIVPLTGYLIAVSNWSQSIVYLCFIASIMIIFSLALSISRKNDTEEQQQEQSLKAVLGEAFINKSYNLLTIGFFVCGFHVSFVATHLPAYLEDISLPLWIGAWSLGLIGFFNVFGTIMFGKMGDSKSKKNLLAILYSLRSLLFLVFIFLPKNEITILIFASMLGILWLSTVPLTSGIISVIFGPRYMSMLYGFTFLSHQLGSFLGSWWGGKLYDYYGSYDIMWWICVLLGFVSAIMHLPIVEKPMVRKLA
jgi:MFS family permease|tara:strand:- start:1365 stop:2573 length:1209 start_codon:yes stop_codon:yes gene_type:complete